MKTLSYGYGIKKVINVTIDRDFGKEVSKFLEKGSIKVFAKGKRFCIWKIVLSFGKGFALGKRVLFLGNMEYISE